MKKKKIKEITDEEFESRLNQFWIEIKDIIKGSNTVNPANAIYSIESPVITNYLLWRLLNEIKIMNMSEKVVKNG